MAAPKEFWLHLNVGCTWGILAALAQLFLPVNSLNLGGALKEFDPPFSRTEGMLVEPCAKLFVGCAEVKVTYAAAYVESQAGRAKVVLVSQ